MYHIDLKEQRHLFLFCSDRIWIRAIPQRGLH